jgi:hypothetical protein
MNAVMAVIVALMFNQNAIPVARTMAKLDFAAS